MGQTGHAKRRRLIAAKSGVIIPSRSLELGLNVWIDYQAIESWRSKSN